MTIPNLPRAEDDAAAFEGAQGEQPGSSERAARDTHSALASLSLNLLELLL